MTDTARPVLADDGEAITLTVYDTAAPRLATAELTPLAALRLAQDLTAAALRHIARQAPP